jgi:hypothetical protein
MNPNRKELFALESSHAPAKHQTLRTQHNLMQNCLLMVVLLAFPAIVQAQFTFTTNNGAITITGYAEVSDSVFAVTIPSETNGLPITGIGPGVFSYDSVGSVTIPDSVTTIGGNAFFECSDLTNATIGDGVTNIGDSAFAGSGLTGITLPDTLVGIGVQAFSGAALSNVTIPDSVTSIGAYAFSGCANLISVNIGAGVTSLGIPPFNFCTNLTAIAVDTNNPAYGSVNGVLFDKNQATLITYPGGLGGSYTIPDSVNTIAEYAFAGCSVSSVTVPNSVTTIGDAAFISSSLTGVTIGAGVTSIGASAFAQTLLLDVTIPNSVTSIGDYAFYYSLSLTNATIPGSVTDIGDSVFADCGSLASATIGNGVTSIGYEAFADCASLTSITIPDSVTTISDNAFQSCANLASVTLGNGVTSIGYEAFFYTSVTNIVIPNSVTSIAENAFKDCANLASATIGNGVTAIGDYAFAGCPLLTSVYFMGNAPAADSTAFLIIGVDSQFYYVSTAYYLSGTTGWAAFSANTLIPAVPWNPLIQTSDASFGVQGNQFGFTVTGATKSPIVVEVSTNLAYPVWTPVATNTLTAGSFFFSEALQTNISGRYYRITLP